MMSSKKQILVAVSTAALLFVVYLFIEKRLRDWQVPQIQKQRIEADRKIIENKSLSEGERQGALMRLSSSSDSLALKVDLERSRSSDVELRRSATFALGFIEDSDAVSRLKELMDDPEQKIRLAAVQALGQRLNSYRKKLLEQIDLDSKKSDAEKIIALGALARAEKNAETKSQLINKIFNHTMITGDPTALFYSLLALQELTPTHKFTGEIVSRILSKNPIPPLTAPVGADVQMAALHFIHVVCPSNRWEILEGIFSSKSSNDFKANALMELLSLNSPEAKVLVKKIIENKWIAGGGEPNPVTIQKQLASSHIQDACRR